MHNRAVFKSPHHVICSFFVIWSIGLQNFYQMSAEKILQNIEPPFVLWCPHFLTNKNYLFYKCQNFNIELKMIL